MDILQSLNNFTRAECGYATVHNVLDKSLEDRMESFFLSETCKYLYLVSNVANSKITLNPFFHILHTIDLKRTFPACFASEHTNELCEFVEKLHKFDVFILLECCALWTGSYSPVFWDSQSHLQGPNSPTVLEYYANLIGSHLPTHFETACQYHLQLDCVTLEDGTNRLSQNVSN